MPQEGSCHRMEAASVPEPLLRGELAADQAHLVGTLHEQEVNIYDI